MSASSFRVIRYKISSILSNNQQSFILSHSAVQPRHADRGDTITTITNKLIWSLCRQVPTKKLFMHLPAKVSNKIIFQSLEFTPAEITCSISFMSTQQGRGLMVLTLHFSPQDLLKHEGNIFSSSLVFQFCQFR